MKKKLRRPFSMRMNLTLIMMGEVAIVTGIGYLVAWLMDYFDVELLLPTYLWLFLASIVLGFLLTFILGHWIFLPITRLGDAMKQVAEGNFQIHCAFQYSGTGSRAPINSPMPRIDDNTMIPFHGCILFQRSDCSPTSVTDSKCHDRYQ